MSNFGFACLRVVQPYELAFREARSAVGATRILRDAEQFKRVEDAVADCSLVIGTTAIGGRKLQQPVVALEEAVKMVRKRVGSSPVAVLFGSEKTGLSNDELSHCHWLLHIPTRKQHLSMNLGQAVAVVLYALAAGKDHEKFQTVPKLANANDLERLTVALAEAAAVSGFIQKESAHVGEQKIRRLVRRLSFQAQDAEMLLGIVRQILWKLRAS
jgi:tRNA/rRNA methyltransferase